MDRLPSFLQIFEQVVAVNGHRTAITYRQKTMTYNKLQQRAFQFSQALSSEGVTAGSVVAVSVSRTDELVPLLLAIWSLGAAYVPIDAAFPADRQRYVLTNSMAKFVLVDAVSPLVKESGAYPFSKLKSLANSIVQSGSISTLEVNYDDLAYIIYTSGSTGNPKGVAVTQRGVLNFLLSMADEPGICKDDVLLAVTTISFDIHVLELFLPLVVGAQIVLANKSETESQTSLRSLINHNQVTMMQATPASWRLILDQGWQPEKPLKILVGGEAFPKDLRASMELASTEIWNMYGPTETTVWSTCYKLSEDETVYIGRAIKNTLLYVVDETLKSVPAGTIGELLIGGAGVAQGYFQRDDLTSERFIHWENDERVYRTGDLVRCHPDGLIEYINRADNQIKIRGYRIEPSEIEAAIVKLDGILQCVVVDVPVTNGDVRLVALYRGNEAPSSDLRTHCKEALPYYMVPQLFVYQNEFPLTANLKVDRKALRTLAGEVINDYSNQTVAQGESARDDLDRSLIAVWEQLLGVRGVQIDDDFFDLGGYSLLALQLVAEMVRVSGLPFDLERLFANPTIRGCVDNLDCETQGAASVVKLNQASDGVPLFCLCGVMIYGDLAREFKNTRPVFGVFASEELKLIDAAQHCQEKLFSFDDLVDGYIEAIFRQGEITNISLAGLSFGGLICLEVAKRMSERGVSVKGLYLLDTYTEASSRRTIAGLAADTWRSLMVDGVKSLFHRVKNWGAKLDGVNLNQLVKFESDRALAFDSAASRWQGAGSQYGIDTVLIKASDMDFGFGLRCLPDYGLSKFIKGKLDVFTVAGDHTSILKGESVAQIHQIIIDHERANSEG